jgi:hypothetical protein
MERPGLHLSRALLLLTSQQLLLLDHLRRFPL